MLAADGGCIIKQTLILRPSVAGASIDPKGHTRAQKKALNGLNPSGM